MLDTMPITHVAGIGPAKARAFAELGIYNIEQLMHYFPYRYEDQRIQPLGAFADGEKIRVIAVVEGPANLRWKAGKAILTARLFVDKQYPITGVWFNQPYQKQKLSDGRVIVVSGKWDAERRTIAVTQTEFNVHRGQDAELAWVPIYRSNRSISSQQIRQSISQALQQYGDELPEVLPYEFTQKYRLIAHQKAVSLMHLPKNSEDLRQAHRRLAFEEFFLFQLQLQWFRRQSLQGNRGISRSISTEAFQIFADSLPYRLTKAQERACHEIAADLVSSRMMNRLLQGDVGSGKTWVALWGAYAAWTSGWQTALMVPTEILAEQHWLEANKRLTPLGMKVALLTGHTAGTARREILRELANGEIAVAIGTHALLTEDIEFHRLGLVITDEQHRFGVAQRGLLRNKGDMPDILFLSATPIPRTLALAIYGDLDVTILDELPKGRQPIRTEWMLLRQSEQAFRKIRQELAKGHQAYIVAPLVEQSENVDLTSATELYASLQEKFAGYALGLLHGRLSARDKEQIMRKFVAGEIHVLVSTTVIEVGIDVPNASIMLIYHAERFGLAQLHQLRGRVGRGSVESFCILLSDPGNDVARKRIETMLETNDGFLIAERDLELRGPGEFLGFRQSGLPEFTVGDLIKDFKVMEVARDEAKSLVHNPQFWIEPRFKPLRDQVSHIYSRSSVRD